MVSEDYPEHLKPVKKTPEEFREEEIQAATSRHPATIRSHSQESEEVEKQYPGLRLVEDDDDSE